jgi:hypothetical protein
MPAEARDSQSVFDLGHRGELDFTQIDRLLLLSPTQRLDRHERWRLFVKEALANAALRQRDREPTPPEGGV